MTHQPRNRTSKAYVYSPSHVPNHYTVTVYTAHGKTLTAHVYTVRYSSPTDRRIDQMDRNHR